MTVEIRVQKVKNKKGKFVKCMLKARHELSIFHSAKYKSDFPHFFIY
jgi:hypothetical protein